MLTLLLGLASLLSTTPANALPTGVHAVPGSHQASSFAVSADGQTVAYSLAANCGYKLCSHYPTFVVRGSQRLRIDDARYRPLTNGGVALSGDGRLAAYPASDHGVEGTVLYDLIRRHVRFIAGFVPVETGPAGTLSQTGRYLLAYRGGFRVQAPGVLDLATGRFVPLPRPPKSYVAIPEFLSGDGHAVLLTDSTSLKGGMAQTVLFSVTSRRSTVLTHSGPFIGQAAFGLGLSANGRVALVTGQPIAGRTTAEATLFGESGPTPIFPGASQFRPAQTAALSLSADGGTIGLACRDSFYLYRPLSGAVSQVLSGFTNGTGRVQGFIAPDGNTVVFSRERANTNQLYGGVFMVATAGATPLGPGLPAACVI